MSKRKNEEDPHTQLRRVLNKNAEEFICPISQELPIDPVIAQDGRVYERQAIARWLATNTTSPYTNEQMQNILISAPQVKNMIESMVKSDALDCAHPAWKEKIRKDRKIELLKEKATKMDVQSMERLAIAYYNGDGVKESVEDGYIWAKKAADLESPGGLSLLAYYYFHSCKHRNRSRAASLMTQAATLGEEYACWFIADGYARASDGFPQDYEQCTYWAKKGLATSISSASKHQKTDMQHWSQCIFEGWTLAHIQSEK
jgi:TPR repeat protein